MNKAFLTGEAKYMSTGRGFVIVHERFLSQYCRYLQSHFVPAFEIMLLLIVRLPPAMPLSIPPPLLLLIISIVRRGGG